MITITFPDGRTKQVESKIHGYDLAKSISERLAKEAVAMLVNGTPKDLTFAIEEDAEIKFVTFADAEGKEVFRHSTSHLLAHAIKHIYPHAQPTIGPVVDEGFYYDFADLKVKEEDLTKIELEMEMIVKQNLSIYRKELSKSQALKIFENNKYKQEIIEESGEETVSIYEQGDFVDLCRGPHVPATGKIKAFKLLKLAGAYWRGDAKNEQLTRIYGISFPERKMLDEHLKFLEEAAKRDHRKIGTEMNLFAIREEIGPGLIIWLPKGNMMKEALEDWAKETEKKWGYQRVTTPLITKEGLFHTSEHLPHYAESMFPPMKLDNENYYIKPMNCPFHHMVFKARARSYRELPLRLAEYGWCHRFEQSGALFGLMRVRGMQMNDAHIYCTKDQAIDEFLDVIKLHEYYYKALGITKYHMVLSLRDPKSDKYHGEESMWQEAEMLMRKAMEKSGVHYEVDIGGAAFYGPKIDFQITSAIGREFSASTNQIDLFMPKKFDLTYMGDDGKEHTPVCIHRAPLGTHERFLGFLIEHYGGRFPLWLSPTQVVIMTLTDDQQEFAQELAKEFNDKNVRVELDDRPESMSKKVFDAQAQRIPLMITIGPKEVEKGTLAVRTLDGKVKFGINRETFIAWVCETIEQRKNVMEL
jgi:threonyl-tRNA synthetase